MLNFEISGRHVGDGCKPFLIAEMSGNHNNSLDRALEIVRSAALSGVDALKIQTFTADTITLNHNSDDFVINNSESPWTGRNLHDLYAEASLNWNWIRSIFTEAKRVKLICFSSIFDETSIDFLEDLDTPAYKIASFENNHIPLIKKAASTGKPLIISTGTASEAGIEEAVAVAREAGCVKLALLKCTSDYPARPEDANLLTIPYLRERFNCCVGLSDHTIGNATAVASVALGATIIEKHFLHDKSQGGVDAKFSADQQEMSCLAADVAIANSALGRKSFSLSKRESENLQFKRSIYASKNISKGELFTPANIRVVRPGYGMHPRFYEALLNKPAHKCFKFGDPITED